ncbi:MAG: PorT family protein [Chitinophagaceae bacterium]|nr:MAG: PorT family protein [Chitinophagaceae bacterium]
MRPFSYPSPCGWSYPLAGVRPARKSMLPRVIHRRPQPARGAGPPPARPRSRRLPNLHMAGAGSGQLRPSFCIVAANFQTMKRSLFLGLALAAGTLAHAQLPKLGIKAGLNIASLSSEGTNDLKSRLGAHGGLLVHIHLGPQFALQPEVLYSAQGAKQEFGNTEQVYKLDYLNVPFMLQYMFRNGFRIEAGPQVGLMLSAKQSDDEGTDDIKSSFKQADFGVGFGLNYLSQTGFGIGGRYNLGVTNINKVGPGDVKNRVGQISVFYMFDRAHKAKSR